MKKTILTFTVIAALVLSLAGCGAAPASRNETPAAESQTEENAPIETEEPTPAETEEPAAAETEETAAEPTRQDGERFDSTIVLEGMEETVHYEHLRNETLGFEMDYDYELLVRHSEADREVFVSSWDDPAHPENYLEVTYDTGNAELVADALIATLSEEYDVTREYRELARSGRCIRLEASVIKGTDRMADQLQTVFIIPAPDGCRVATEHCFTVESEGFFKRFTYMLDTLTVLDRGVETTISDELALSTIRYYCYENNPELESIVNGGEHHVSWEIASSSEQEIVILYTSYTGAEIRYYIDRSTGDTYATEFVPGVMTREERTEESFNVFDYIG